jgi:pyruvate,water dikinase
MTTTATTPNDPVALRWEAPGPGDFRGLHDHFPRALTPEYQELLRDGMIGGEADWCESYGFPIRSIRPDFVHGRVFISTVPLVGPATDRLPPAWAMKLAVRLVPAFRRRTRAAARAVVDRPWLAEAEQWFAVERPAWEQRDAAFEAIDVAVLDDDALVAHLAAVRALAGEGYRTHFRLHGCDLVPTGLYLADSQRWGIDPVAAAGLLAGSSPASRGEGATPAWCLVSGYDLDERCAIELPAWQPAPSRPSVAADAESEQALRSQVPAAQRARWDRYLADARATCGVRDSNGLLTAAWPAGLLRRAMLEAGRRLVDRGRLEDTDHAVELTVAELAGALEGRSGAPSAADASERAAARRVLSAHRPPASLGRPQDLPLGALPPAVAELATALLALRDLGITPPGHRDELRGTGLGRGTATGRACVTADPAVALARFEPGDIVVTAGTCPAWNSILALAGGVVTEEGGPLSHAAVIARELGLPAVIGCRGAVAAIADGATVVLDLDEGTVREVDAS